MRTGVLRKSDQYRYVAEQRKAKTIDRFRVFRWVLELQPPPGITVNKMPLMVLAVHYKPETGQCFPSIPTIAKGACMSKSPVKRALKQYVELGWVSRVKRGWHGRSTVYALHVHLNPIPVLSDSSMSTPVARAEGGTLSPLVVSVPHTAPLQDRQRAYTEPSYTEPLEPMPYVDHRRNMLADMATRNPDNVELCEEIYSEYPDLRPTEESHV